MWEITNFLFFFFLQNIKCFVLLFSRDHNHIGYFCFSSKKRNTKIIGYDCEMAIDFKKDFLLSVRRLDAAGDHS